VQPFADVLAIPGLAARAVVIALEQARRIELSQPVAFISGYARADPPIQVHAVRHLEILPVGDGRRHLFGDGRDGACLRYHRQSYSEGEGEIACRHVLLVMRGLNLNSQYPIANAMADGR
jgi:hypothetical protein